MSSFGFPGHEMRQRREELHLTLADVHEAVHIPIQYLRALEDGAFSELPAETYGVGFVASYARHLGLDPNRYADAYRECRSEAAPVFSTRRQTIYGERPGLRTELITWAGVCGVLLLLWVTYTVVVGTNTSPNTPAVEAETQELIPPTPAPDAEFPNF